MPKFSRQHYEAIANVLSSLRYVNNDKGGVEPIDELIRHAPFVVLCNSFVQMFRHDNPKFDGARFMNKVLHRGAQCPATSDDPLGTFQGKEK